MVGKNMKKFLLISLFLVISSCDDKFPNGTRNNCVDLDFDKACKEVSKRGVGRQYCIEDQKCHFVCEPLDKEIHKDCCYDNDAYEVFLKKVKRS